MNQATANQPHLASVKSYFVGFFISLALTVAAFLAASLPTTSGNYLLIALLLLLAILQTSTQLWFFLHVGREEKPNWNTIFLFNTIGIILLIVIASIWIMNSLYDRMMSPEQMEYYMMEEGSKGGF